MARLFQQSEATAARRRFPVYLVDATDGITPETGEAAGQPQISKNGAAFGNTSATLTAIGNGAYYVELTATELDTLGLITIRYKSANTAEFNMDGQVVALDPYDSVRGGLTALPNAAADGAGGLPISDAGGLALDTILDAAISTRAAASVCTEGRLAELDAGNLPADVAAIPTNPMLDTEDGSSFTAIPWNAAWDTEVESECTDALVGVGLGVQRDNTAQGGTSSTITLDAGASATDNWYNCLWCWIYGGTGSGQIRAIRTYAGTTKIAAVSPDWTTTPDNTSTFRILLRPASHVVIDANSYENDAITSQALDSSATNAIAAVTAGATLTTQMTEAYAAQGTAPTMAQALFLIHQSLFDSARSGTTWTIKKLDQSTTAATVTYDDGTNPTSTTRAT